MLPFSVTILATVPQRLEIPEGLTNYPAYIYYYYYLSNLSYMFWRIPHHPQGELSSLAQNYLPIVMLLHQLQSVNIPHVGFKTSFTIIRTIFGSALCLKSYLKF
jgi:hypothetical protein